MGEAGWACSTSPLRKWMLPWKATPSTLPTKAGQETGQGARLGHAEWEDSVPGVGNCPGMGPRTAGPTVFSYWLFHLCRGPGSTLIPERAGLDSTFSTWVSPP